MGLGSDLGLSTKSTKYFVVLMPSQDFYLASLLPLNENTKLIISMNRVV